MYIFPFGMCVLVQVLGSVYEVMLSVRVAGWDLPEWLACSFPRLPQLFPHPQ